MSLTLPKRNQLIDLIMDNFNIKKLKDLCNRLGDQQIQVGDDCKPLAEFEEIQRDKVIKEMT